MFIKGKELINVIKEETGVVKDKTTVVGTDVDRAIKLMEQILPMVVRVDARLNTLESRTEDILELETETNAAVLDNKTKTYVGKKPEFIDEVIEEVKSLSPKEIRKLIYRASRNQQEGYLKIYSKLMEITGVDIYQAGKMRINKRDGLGFTNPGYSYINTLFHKGIEKEAAAVALDMIRNK